ncbi:tryptase beta-2 [Trichonephila inaurata madagascariensis]|uniref:Tryptase beta-2 n=1 Tax=Trichonephila inaurata madagascariensis TaxID=2747483 RepID=A0A8X6IH45_9ARAC|nr:tryptase beta-2 [Trichonephila inaurata madagascariensis]
MLFIYEVPLFDNIGIRCGGAVISKKYVLTAAHCLCRIDKSRYSESGDEECVQNPKDYYIKLLGKKKLGKLVKIKRIISHPDFDYSKVINDIALIELKKPLKCNEMISPICLPTSEEFYKNGQNSSLPDGASTISGRNLVPRLLSSTKRFYTLGVVSHGTAIHCIPTYPTTFSKTLYFLDWIREHVEDLPKP